MTGEKVNNNSLPLITVVVPVYKVEQYLAECVDSILNQTYTNLEIYLVDDGSPDRCGEICNEYAKKDSRIRVIHQENKGLSGARNSAIDVFKGDYITFVDSDDWISDEMIERLYKNLIEYDAQMSCTSPDSFYEDGTHTTTKYNGEVFVYTKEQALDCFLFNDYLTPCVCGKLYMRNLWTSVRCPEGMLFEDQFTTYKLIDQCNKIIYCTKPMYHYRKRAGSIGHSVFNRNTYNLYDAIQEEYEYIHTRYGQEVPNIAVARITWEIVFVNMMIASGYKDHKVKAEIQKFARKNLTKVWKCNYISILRKGQISLFALSYPVYNIFYMLYKKKHPIA